MLLTRAIILLLCGLGKNQLALSLRSEGMGANSPAKGSNACVYSLVPCSVQALVSQGIMMGALYPSWDALLHLILQPARSGETSPAISPGPLASYSYGASSLACVTFGGGFSPGCPPEPVLQAVRRAEPLLSMGPQTPTSLSPLTWLWARAGAFQHCWGPPTAMANLWRPLRWPQTRWVGCIQLRYKF